MTVIWKFTLPKACQEHEGAVINMPQGATILSCQQQGRELMLWAKVDEKASLEGRKFIICGTGHPINERLSLDHVGTIQLGESWSPLVLHVFEVLS